MSPMQFLHESRQRNRERAFRFGSEFHTTKRPLWLQVGNNSNCTLYFSRPLCRFEDQINYIYNCYIDFLRKELASVFGRKVTNFMLPKSQTTSTMHLFTWSLILLHLIGHCTMMPNWGYVILTNLVIQKPS